MLAFTIPDTRHFMALLLKGDAFDDFAFRRGEISAFAYVSIDGKRDLDYYDETVTEPWCSWSEIKSLVFQAVKGKKTPKNMKLCSFPFLRKKQHLSPTQRRCSGICYSVRIPCCAPFLPLRKVFLWIRPTKPSGKAGCWTFARAMALPFRKKINIRNFVSTQFD